MLKESLYGIRALHLSDTWVALYLIELINKLGASFIELVRYIAMKGWQRKSFHGLRSSFTQVTHPH